MSLSDTWVNFRDNVTGGLAKRIMESPPQGEPARPVTSNPVNGGAKGQVTSHPLFMPAVIGVGIVILFLMFRKG